MPSADKQLQWAPVPKTGCWATPIGKALMADPPAEIVDCIDQMDTMSQASLMQQSETIGNLQDAAAFPTYAKQSADTVAEPLHVNSASKGVCPEAMTQLEHDSLDIAASQPRPGDGPMSESTEDDITNRALSILKLGPGVDPKDAMTDFVEQLCDHTGDDLKQVSERLCDVARKRHEQLPAMPAMPAVASDECDSVVQQEKQFFEELEAQGYAVKVSCTGVNTVGHRWRRWLRADPGNKTKYDQLRGHNAKALFRAQWAKEQHEEFKKELIHSKKTEHQDIVGGKYHTLNRIAHLEGGGPKGMRNACNYAMACLKMGGKWTKYCDMTKDVKYNYVEHGFWEKFTETWTSTSTWATNQRANSVANQSSGKSLCEGRSMTDDQDEASHCEGSPAPTPAAPAPAPAAENSHCEGRKRTTDGSVDSPIAHKVPRTDAVQAAQPKGKAKAKPKAKASASWMQQAKLTKQAYASSMVQASTIQGQIDTDAKWAWAKSPEIEVAVSAARNALSSTMASNPTFHDILTADLNAARKAATDDATFEVQTKHFSQTLDPLIKTLQKQCQALLEQHAVRLKITQGND